MLLGVTIVLIVMLWEYWETGFTAFIPDRITRDGFGVPCRLLSTDTKRARSEENVLSSMCVQHLLAPVGWPHSSPTEISDAQIFRRCVMRPNPDT